MFRFRKPVFPLDCFFYKIRSTFSPFVLCISAMQLGGLHAVDVGGDAFLANIHIVMLMMLVVVVVVVVE